MLKQPHLGVLPSTHNLSFRPKNERENKIPGTPRYGHLLCGDTKTGETGRYIRGAGCNTRMDFFLFFFFLSFSFFFFFFFVCVCVCVCVCVLCI